jgi:hypothetical protein
MGEVPAVGEWSVGENPVEVLGEQIVIGFLGVLDC